MSQLNESTVFNRWVISLFTHSFDTECNSSFESVFSHPIRRGHNEGFVQIGAKYKFICFSGLTDWLVTHKNWTSINGLYDDPRNKGLF